MANFTRNAIKDTFIKLLEERPLTDITVKDIVEICGINRNSFYYHFQDIPALLEEIVMEEAEEIIRKYPTIIRYYKCVCFGLTIDWLCGGMKEEDVASVRSALLVRKDLAAEMALQFRDSVADIAVGGEERPL